MTVLSSRPGWSIKWDYPGSKSQEIKQNKTKQKTLKSNHFITISNRDTKVNDFRVNAKFLTVNAPLLYYMNFLHFAFHCRIPKPPIVQTFFLNYHIIASSLNQSQSLRSSQDSVWLSFLYQSTECMRWEKPIDVMCHYIVKEETYPSLGNSCLISTWWWLRSSAVFELKTWKTHQYNYVGCYKICLKLMSQWSA